MRKLTKRITTMLLSVMLVIGSAPGSVFAASTDVDPGQTSEIAEEAFAEETSEASAGAGGSRSEAASTEEEAAVQYYTVTLDANGGYFENEWDDSIGDYAQQEEVVEKLIPVDGTIASFPVCINPNGQTMFFAGWSLERDGELIATGDEEYAPVENCVLYAAWKTADEYADVNAGVVDTAQETDTAGESGDNGMEESEPAQEYEDSEVVDVTETESEDTEETESAQEFEETADEVDIIQETTENSYVDSDDYATPETDNERDTAPAQEVICSDEERGETSEEVDDASEEIIHESLEEEEAISEDAAMGIVDSGTCGENLTWVLDNLGILTISGMGKIEDHECLHPYQRTIKKVIIENGVTSIGEKVFLNYSNLTNVTIPDSVTSIGEEAFWNCSNLTNVTIPDSVTSIGEEAFALSGLKSVTISNSVTNIGGLVFWNCKSLESVTIPNSVTSIEISAFNGCSNLTSVDIPNSVTIIGNAAFSGCSNLTSVDIPNSVTIIDDSAFRNCSSLTSITIPNSVTRIGDGAFFGCNNLTNIIVEPDNNKYCSKDGVLYDKKQTTLITYPPGKENNYSITEGVKSISNYAFSCCANLTSVTIPGSVTKIGNKAFYGCDSLSDVHYGGTLDNWSSISVGQGNECLNNASLHFPPLIVSPVGEQIREVYPGQEVLLEVSASSGYQIHYQWFEDEYDCEIEGEISNSCVISTYYDADFSCHVSDDYGNKVICTFSLRVVTVNNNLKAYVSGWEEDVKSLGVFVDPYETSILEVTATADEMDGLTYTWYDQDNKLIQGATEATYQTGRLIRTGTIRCEVKDKYYNVESVYFSINIDNNLIAYSDSDDNHKDYSDIYVSPGDNLNLHVVVEASDMDDIQYQWLDDQYKEIPGATDTYYSVNNIEEFTYLIFRTIDRYGNKKQVYFYIWVRNLISNAEIVFTESTLTYTGREIMPIASLFYDGKELFEGDDYSVDYNNNINAGLATATITGKGNYTGTKTTTFIINKATQSIAASNLSLTYSKTGTITTSRNKGKLTYKSANTAVAVVDSTGKVTAKGAGTAKITITAAETSNYKKATKTISVTIAKGTQSLKATAAASSIAVGKSTTVSLTGAKGTKSFKSSDTAIATVSSTGKVTAKKVGKVTITATSAATSNFNKASASVKINVVPAATTSISAANQATGIKLIWKKVAGATGYLVYRGSTKIATIKTGSTVTYTDTKANANGAKYTFKIIPTASTGKGPVKSLTTYRVARPAISSVANSTAVKMTVKWGKNTKGTGYQIHYCTDKTFKSGNKSVSITSASTLSKVIGSLTKGKTYYVRIRTYKTVGKTKYWSAWSVTKSVKIKK